jgi:hypothetical protein
MIQPAKPAAGTRQEFAASSADRAFAPFFAGYWGPIPPVERYRCCRIFVRVALFVFFTGADGPHKLEARHKTGKRKIAGARSLISSREFRQANEPSRLGHGPLGKFHDDRETPSKEWERMTGGNLNGRCIVGRLNSD